MDQKAFLQQQRWYHDTLMHMNGLQMIKYKMISDE